jgi:hypothetical protein
VVLPWIGLIPKMAPGSDNPHDPVSLFTSAHANERG